MSRTIISCLVLFITTILWAASPARLGAQEKNIRSSRHAAFDPGSIHPDAPAGTALLGRLLGTWDAYQVKRNRDGTWSDDTTRAEWRWYAILDGHGIQDDWINLEKNDDGSWSRSVAGTNIRIYNDEEKRWHMAWIDKNNRRLATFTASEEGGAIVMDGHNAQGRHVRNTFFDISDQAFQWQQAWTFDDGATWLVVARILCERKLQR